MYKEPFLIDKKAKNETICVPVLRSAEYES